MQTDNLILTYNIACKVGAIEVGNKSFNVAYSNAHEILVPDGIILPIQAFRSYINGDSLEELFLKIEKFFKNVKLLIVRSSALQEDTLEASYAGQYLSMICKNSAAEIKMACDACWSSSFSSNVEAYQNVMGQPGSEYSTGMGLLIQEVVKASSSGVCFTKDPLKDNKDIFIVNAVHGMGEALMAEEVVADHYEFDIKREKAVKKITGIQTNWRSPECPHILSHMPQNLLGKSVLTETQIKEIARMAQRAARLFENHLDIEWAYEGEKLFLLQVRPITQVANKREFELWTRDNVADVIPDAVTPLTWSVVKKATNKAFKNAIRDLGFPFEPTEFFRVFDGRVYFNQTAYQKMLNPGIKRNPLFFIKVGVKYLLLLFTLKKTVARMTNEFAEGLNSLATYPEKSAISKLKSRLDKYMAIHIRVAVLMELGFLVIRKVSRKYIPEDQENKVIDGLATGLNEIESTASGKALLELASLIKDNRKLTEVILSSANQSVPDVLGTWGGIYSIKWEEFLDHYGHSSLKEFEIYYPRWKEDPSFIVTTLKQYLIENKGIDIKTTRTRCSGKRIESEKALLRNTPLMYYFPLKFYIKHVRQCSVWRESIKQKLVRIMAEIRRQAMIFAEKCKIETPENVFFLTTEEIFQFKDDFLPAELLEKIGTRKKSWEKWERQKPYKEIRIFDDDRQIKIPYLSGVGSRLNGMPLSSGKFTGPARVIMDPTEMDEFNLGDVLVAPSTNPSWTPLFTLAGAIVTDMGNYLSHGAIVARELGIPAVGNVFDATKRIKDGQIIFVDGESGFVKLTQDENL